jgi:hypothetical protein
MIKHEIIDNAYSAADMERMFGFVRNSNFRLGWQDQHWNDITGQRRILYSDYSQEDLDNMELLYCHNSPRITELINGRTPVKAAINLAEPANTFLPHTHVGEEVLLYYVNHRWNPEWAGETIIYADHDNEAEHAVSFKPGRVLWLKEGVKHSVRPPSNACPEYRFTCAVMFKV